SSFSPMMRLQVFRKGRFGRGIHSGLRCRFALGGASLGGTGLGGADLRTGGLCPGSRMLPSSVKNPPDGSSGGVLGLRIDQFLIVGRRSENSRLDRALKPMSGVLALNAPCC